MLVEIKERSSYLAARELSSVYLGGGTPSLLDQNDLERLFAGIQAQFSIQSDAEITLEANPDDLSTEKLKMLRDSPVNRLSIGIQSFFDEDLRFMNRAHNAGEARSCVEAARQFGFDQLTIDLIFGSPTTSDDHWAENVRIALDLEVPHLSCYGLTVEPQTALDHFIRKGKAPPVDEEQSARQFEYLMATAQERGYVHYEISNFALPGQLAKHNTSYWQGEPYLGIGPSAHSFNGTSRQWNAANNARYLKAMKTSPAEWPALLFEKEELSVNDRYNERILTGLRTIWGISLDQVDSAFQEHFLQNIQQFIDKKMVEEKEGRYCLTTAGKLLGDHVSANLFI